MAFISYDELGNILIRGMDSKMKIGEFGANEKMSSTNLYIRGIPSYFNESSLRNLIPPQFCIKSVKIAKDEQGQCKGYGFIDFVSKKYANEAKEYLELNYSIYPVKYAKENEKDRTNLYISQLPKQWTSTDCDKLKSVFEKFGYVQSAFIMVERNSNKPTGVGFVRYSREEEADRALMHINTTSMTLPGSTKPLEAKYADKHSPESRKRRNSASNDTSLSSGFSTAPSLTIPSTRITPPKQDHLISSIQTNSSAYWDQSKSSPLLLPSPTTGGLLSGNTFVNVTNHNLIPSLLQYNVNQSNSMQPLLCSYMKNMSSQPFNAVYTDSYLNPYFIPGAVPNNTIPNGIIESSYPYTLDTKGLLSNTNFIPGLIPNYNDQYSFLLDSSPNKCL